jgi:hypothetical protein
VEDGQHEYQYMITHSQKQSNAIDRLKALARKYGAPVVEVNRESAL